MSSHHIIREDQEPALIIANGQPCSYELMGQLLEWSPLVLVLDSALPKVIDLGIKVDVVLGDFDNNFDPNKYTDFQLDMKIVNAPNQNKTDLEKGIEYLIEKGHTAANIVWATGHRADHTLANISILAKYKEQIKLCMLDDYSKIYCITPHFSKWYTAGTIISLMPVGQVQNVFSSGLAYELTGQDLVLGFANGNSNAAITDGLITITHQNGHLLMMECND